MKSTFPNPKEQAENVLKVIQDGDHAMHQLALETITVEDLIHLIDLAERSVKV